MWWFSHSKLHGNFPATQWPEVVRRQWQGAIIAGLDVHGWRFASQFCRSRTPRTYKIHELVVILFLCWTIPITRFLTVCHWFPKKISPCHEMIPLSSPHFRQWIHRIRPNDPTMAIWIHTYSYIDHRSHGFSPWDTAYPNGFYRARSSGGDEASLDAAQSALEEVLPKVKSATWHREGGWTIIH